MEMDPEIDNALVNAAEAAAERWAARTRVRDERTAAVERRAFLEADSPTRVAARVNHIIDQVRRSASGGQFPSNSLLKELALRPLPVTTDELTDEIVNEVVIGARDFLSVEFLERGADVARSVGRILIVSGGRPKARGTGFLVGPSLLLTNEHVLTSPELAARCLIEMDYEQNSFGATKPSQTFRLTPERFFLNDDKLDYALVAVAPTSTQGAPLSAYGWLGLNPAQGKISVSAIDALNIVQHPLGNEKTIVIRNNRLLDLRTGDDEAEEIGPFLHYEADTEKGSSGSPVLNDGWEVVGLHHSGVPAMNEARQWLTKDGEIWNEGDPVENIQWVANEAVRVSSLIAAINLADLDDDRRQFLDTALASRPTPAAVVRGRTPEGGDFDIPRAIRPARTGRPVAPGEMTGHLFKEENEVAIKIPLCITVSVGQPETPATQRQRRAPTPRPMHEVVALERLESEDFADREGYNRNFLGTPIPLPKLKGQPRFGGALKIARPARPADKTELRYYNYSVIMCASRRLAYVSAANLNFAAKATANRDQGRGDFRLDPRCDPKDQLGGRYYDYNDYDKGHLTRRDDAAWGDSLEEAIIANDDTFFYTNSGPQYFEFNRSDDFTHANLDLWGDLENHISQQGEAQKTRITLFNGPIFGARDKPLFDALVPLRYYKIVIWKDKNQTPGAIGFVLDQADLIESLAEEAIDPGRFVIRQRRIADIEAELDIDFGKVVEWDRLTAAMAHEALDDDGIEIMSVNDIRM